MRVATRARVFKLHWSIEVSTQVRIFQLTPRRQFVEERKALSADARASCSLGSLRAVPSHDRASLLLALEANEATLM